MSGTAARQASTAAEVSAVTGTLALAFADDPVWGLWAFPDPRDRVERLTRYWQPFVTAGLKYGGVWMTKDAGAIAVWVPPGVAEMDAQDEAATAAMIDRECGDRAPALHAAFARFDAAHPHDQPHWYLSLLGTRPDHRGRGLGMALVAQQLQAVDEQGVGAYLESTNDANLRRYSAAGFSPRDTFTLDGGPTITTMWRPPR